MTKADAIQKIKEKAGFSTTAQAEATLNSMLEAITEGIMSEGSILLSGFGSFKVTQRSARKGRNPQTGQEIKIPASKTVKFSPSKALKDAI